MAIFIFFVLQRSKVESNRYVESALRGRYVLLEIKAARDATFVQAFRGKQFTEIFGDDFLNNLENTIVYNGSTWKSVQYTFTFHIIPNHFSLHQRRFPPRPFRDRWGVACTKHWVSKLLHAFTPTLKETKTYKNVWWIIETLTTNALKLIRLKAWISATILSSAWQFTTSTRGKTRMGLFIALQVARLWVWLLPAPASTWRSAPMGVA